MAVLKFRRFTRPRVLQRIGRKLLVRFFERFEPELASLGVVLPPPALPDSEWAQAVARLFAVPEELPDSLCEALYAIDEMATPEGQEQLEMAMEQAGLPLAVEPGASRQDIALQVWLADPALLARIHNRQRLLRLTAFEYFGAEPRVAPLPPPETPPLRELAATLDHWFARHHRGHNTSRIELYTFAAASGPPEYWFLIRHGDTFSRTSKVEQQKTEIIHFRPQRDDVVVYSQARNELRINARSRGERDLYVRAFGRYLRGDPGYFSVRNTYTLEPLREAGSDALHTGDIPVLEKVTLRRVEAVEEGAEGTENVVCHEARDLFDPRGLAGADFIPRTGRLRSADFDLHFAGCPRPRPMQIRLPNVLKLRRHCDLHLVDKLVSRFRVRGVERRGR